MLGDFVSAGFGGVVGNVGVIIYLDVDIVNLDDWVGGRKSFGVLWGEGRLERVRRSRGVVNKLGDVRY